MLWTSEGVLPDTTEHSPSRIGSQWFVVLFCRFLILSASHAVPEILIYGMIPRGLRSTWPPSPRGQHPPFPLLLRGGAPAPGPADRFGTHHSKGMLLFYPTGLRVMITTANFVPGDWHCLNQGLWAQDFPLAQGAAVAPPPHPTGPLRLSLAAGLPRTVPTAKWSHFQRKAAVNYIRRSYFGMVGVSNIRPD